MWSGWYGQAVLTTGFVFIFIMWSGWYGQAVLTTGFVFIFIMWSGRYGQVVLSIALVVCINVEWPVRQTVLCTCLAVGI